MNWPFRAGVGAVWWSIWSSLSTNNGFYILKVFFKGRIYDSVWPQIFTDSPLEEKWLTPALRTLSSHNYSTSEQEVLIVDKVSDFMSRLFQRK